MLELLVVTPDGVASPPELVRGSPEASSISFAFSGASEPEQLPHALREGIAGLVDAGGGCIVMDSWNRRTDLDFRQDAKPEHIRADVTATARNIRQHLGRIPVHMLMVPIEEQDSHLDSLASGLVELHWEHLDGVEVRVLRLAKWANPDPPPATHFFFSLAGGGFACPPLGGATFRAAVGVADPDPGANHDSVWPGTSEYERAFGRLRHNASTGFELDESTPNSLIRVLELPVVISVLRSHGRIAWIPSISGPLEPLVTEIGPMFPPGTLGDSVRLYSWSGSDPAPPNDRSGLISADDSRSNAEEQPTGVEQPIQPHFPAIYDFLRQAVPGSPTLLLLALDGLKSRAAMLGGTLDDRSLPMILQNLNRLPRFHAMVFGRYGDNATRALFPNLDNQVRVYQKHGQTLLVSLRPKASAFLMSPQDGAPGFSLLNLT
jgi:hypothetical protein